MANLELKAKSKGLEKPYFEWVVDYWSSRGKKLDFDSHLYLKDIYRDQSPSIAIMKSAQVGITERMLTEALWLPDQYKENSLYLFPTSGTISDLVQERVDDPINNHPYLQMVSGRAKRLLGKQADKVGLKRMSKGFVYFRGSNVPTQITSVSADAVFVDEVDRMLPESMAYFDKRLEHSSRKWMRWGSTPTIPNFGIHKIFLNSDQRYFNIKCPHCNEWQNLTFIENIDIEKGVVICKKCKRVIVPWQCQGEWVKTRESNIHGYHISQLYSSRLDVKKLVEDNKKASEWDIQQFYNQNLGLPYTPKGDKITMVDIQNCIDDYVMPDYSSENIFMGVDVGKFLHYVIRDDKNRILDCGKVGHFFGEMDSLEYLVQKFDIRGIVIDALPETRKVSELVSKYRGKVKMCYYSGMNELKSGDKYWKVEGDKVNTDRTISIDNMIAEFKKRIVRVPKNIDSEGEFLAHLQAPVRVISENKSGVQKASYIETGEDHLFHACNYAKIAVNIFDVATPEIFIL